MSLNIDLIRESFEAIKPHADEVVTRFYQTLFKKYPAAEPLFARANMQKQKAALAGSLSHIVDYLDDTEHLVDYLQKMGGRHNTYGVRDEHYAWVGDALLDTLQYYLGEYWTPELKGEWVKFYTVATEQMQEGQRTMAIEKPVATAKPVDSQFSSDLGVSTRKMAIEILKHAFTEPETQNGIKDSAREQCKIVLNASLLLEIDDAFRAMAREKAKEILKQAIEEEVKAYVKSVAAQAA